MAGFHKNNSTTIGADARTDALARVSGSLAAACRGLGELNRSVARFRRLVRPAGGLDLMCWTLARDALTRGFRDAFRSINRLRAGVRRARLELA